ncbi:family 43 glycosylhydrolase [Pedobacter psychroterrae]|uniref:Glycosyl hydrolase family 43 n=1 Tax=Pedobacter psychroterrae TaxID=2530453 RepID=A0A4V2MLY0_9SPHI|nr:family 43 glycosylhydrolase [Pedobacter psychroterrae]TCD03867.1 hypothetical protein EZ437_07940 [Pedobacter psychroterrae]
MIRELKIWTNLNAFLMMVLSLSIGSAYAQTSKGKGPGNRRYTTTLTNFNSKGEQTIRFDNMGEAMDAHDGEIAVFAGVYYLYGTSYGCGFEWGKKDAPFCGFKVYSSTDMVTWTDRGMLFDASTPLWQSRCNGSTYGCFRPHVVYNKTTRLFVLWINVYDNRVGFRVFTSASPTGPFREVVEPKLAVNSDSPVAGLNNGDHDTFVDKDGKGYIAYTDWRTTGTIVIEELTGDYLSGTGKHVKAVTAGNTEAPSLFRRGDLYYVTYSDPNCGYCSGTGTSYKTATSVLGPWSEGIKISDNSCGGQPSFVSPIELTSGTIYLYGSDLWNNAAKNEALANYYWAPLTFREDGSIMPMVCQAEVSLDLAKGAAGSQVMIKNLDNHSGLLGFIRHCDISRKLQRGQSFIAARSGILTAVVFTAFKTGYPNADLTIDLYLADAGGLAQGSALKTMQVKTDKVSWSPNQVKVAPNVSVSRGQRYVIVVRSASTTGCYGFAYSDELPYKEGIASISTDGGNQFREEPGRTLKFYSVVN